MAAVRRSAPWANASAAAAASHHKSLADIAREQADESLAAQLQQREGRREPAPQTPPQGTASGPAQPQPQPQQPQPQPETTEAAPGEDDALFAQRLQALEDEAARLRLNSQNSGAPVTAATNSLEDDDHALAVLLQEQLNEEHDRRIDELEKLANLTSSKVSYSLERFRSPYPANPLAAPGIDHTPEEEEAHWDDDIEEAVAYDRTTRTLRDAEGGIVTKHNPTVSGRRNRQRVENDFPLAFASGDMKGGPRDDVRLSNKVYTSLKRFAVKEEKAAARLHEKKEHSTAEMAMDKNTRLTLYKLLNRGILTEVNGAISTGKESVVFHGRAHQDARDETSPEIECAIKVFKTTLTEFTQRQQFLHGDRRFERRVGRQHARKLVRMWAEKEMSNLTRMWRAGLRCPQVVMQRRHVLVMSFVGQDGHPAPKLKDVHWTPSKLQEAFTEVLNGMTTMYRDCALVHCDLSEYNMLYWDRHVYFIDVGQAVDWKHPRADEYLYRDCLNVQAFFDKAGAEDLPEAHAMFEHITEKRLTLEQRSDFAEKIHSVDRGSIKPWEEEQFKEGESDILLRYGAGDIQLPYTDFLQEGSEDEDEDEEDDEDEEEEHEEKADQREQVVASGENVDRGRSDAGAAAAST